MSRPAGTKHLDVYAFMRSRLVQKQRLPTRREINARFGWRSTNASQRHVQRLASCGLIRLDGGHYTLTGCVVQLVEAS
jgi:SOS-response transcriptional repressor LexA